jgi:hypothetical protein
MLVTIPDRHEKYQRQGLQDRTAPNKKNKSGTFKLLLIAYCCYLRQVLKTKAGL